ncbi:MAG: flagellar basal body P-ring formation protein FlgA [Planctomycetes bacterium]|nr:flagellar basal body P-ring formation protein FlgA [Planctomycetota bacterium]
MGVRWIQFGAALVILAQSLRADSIVLRSSVRLDAQSPVTLRDVATLSGSDAEALGTLVVREAQKGAKPGEATISLDELRSTLNAAKTDIRWGKIALSGDNCTIRLVDLAPAAEEAPAAEPVSVRPVQKAPAGPTWRVVADMQDESLRAAIGHRLANFIKAEAADVRIAFYDQDAKLLDTPATGRVLDIQPTGLGAIVPVVLRVFEGEKVVAAGTVRVRIEQKLDVVGASKALHRGDIVSKADIFSESRWTPPGDRLASESSVLGSVVKNRLQPGELFLDGDTEAAILVKRGDIVNIACVSGSIVMNTKARALANAKENDVIEFAPLRNTKSKVVARVVSPGQAVIAAEQGDDQVFVNQPAPAPPETDTQATRPKGSPAARPAQATVGAITVKKVTNKPDGTFVVEAETHDPRKPVKKMKFLPFEDQ